MFIIITLTPVLKEGTFFESGLCAYIFLGLDYK